MATTTIFDYHTDENAYGSYQYITLKELVDYFEQEKTEDDSVLKNLKRTTFIRHLKNGIRKLNRRVFNDIRAIEITVPENLKFQLPHNYVNWVRTSLVVQDIQENTYKLKELNRNYKINIAEPYLQDHNGEILFTDLGEILTTNLYYRPYKKYTFDNDSQSGSPSKDTSELSKYGEFNIDERNGNIVFSSDLDDKEIVFEYLTDGLEFDTYGEDAIRIHKDGIDTLIDWVFYCCIRWKKGSTRGERQDALLRYKTTLHRAKLTRMNFNLLEVERVMRTSSKQ